MSEPILTEFEPLLGLPDGEVKLREWTPEWAALFELERSHLASKLTHPVSSIEHIGSTSVPGLIAKPVLDMMIGVGSFEASLAIVPLMERLGYTYKGENGIPRRHYFVKGVPRTHHVHVFEIGSENFARHLAFRDRLRSHNLLRDAYAMLKHNLLTSPTREAYQDGKSTFIRRVSDLPVTSETALSFQTPEGEILIRRYRVDDPIPSITSLLHRAYKQLADLNLHFWATWQDDKITGDRINSGECFVAMLKDEIVGTITCYGPHVSAATILSDISTASFGQFAVEPRLQRSGLGSRMLEVVEQHARDLGFESMALDTAEPATHLIEYYSRKGYRVIERVQWDRVNYRSVVLRREL